MEGKTQLTLNCNQTLSTFLLFGFRWLPHQRFTEALDRSPLYLASYLFRLFLIRLSWIIRGVIYFNRHLLDSWKENSATRKQEQNIAWLISHFRRVSTSWREILSQWQKFVWGLSVLPLESELSVVNNMNLLWRLSENISIRLHMLTFSVLEMWVGKWPVAFLQQGAWVIPRSCSFAHSPIH